MRGLPLLSGAVRPRGVPAASAAPGDGGHCPPRLGGGCLTGHRPPLSGSLAVRWGQTVSPPAEGREQGQRGQGPKLGAAGSLQNSTGPGLSLC